MEVGEGGGRPGGKCAWMGRRRGVGEGGGTSNSRLGSLTLKDNRQVGLY